MAIIRQSSLFVKQSPTLGGVLSRVNRSFGDNAAGTYEAVADFLRQIVAGYVQATGFSPSLFSTTTCVNQPGRDDAFSSSLRGRSNTLLLRLAQLLEYTTSSTFSPPSKSVLVSCARRIHQDLLLVNHLSERDHHPLPWVPFQRCPTTSPMLLILGQSLISRCKSSRSMSSGAIS